MYDTSSSSCSESEDEEVEKEYSSRLNRKLQETPSLAKEVKHNLSIDEARVAWKISNVPNDEGGFFAGGVPGKSRTGESFGAPIKRKQGEERGNAKFKRKGFIDKAGSFGKEIEKKVTRRQILEARHSGGRQIFKRAIMISSSSTSEDEEEEEKRAVRVCKRWNMISSDEEEEDSIGQAGSPWPDNESHPAEPGPPQSHTTSKNVNVKEASVREEVFLQRENTPPSSSLGPSPPNSPTEPYVQQKTTNLDKKQKEKREYKNVLKRKEGMLEEMLLKLLDERGKRCKGEEEKELLCIAVHLVQCRGCDDARLHGKDCRKCNRSTPKERAEAILQDGSLKTLQSSKVRSTVEEHQRKEERRKEALEKMRVKAKKIKEKQEQQKREREAKPQPFPELQNAEKFERVGQGSEHKQYSITDLRIRTVKLLQAAIESCNLTELDDVQNIVTALEQSIFGLSSSVAKTYKQKVRTIIWNLKENSELTSNLLTGVITPGELASMSTEEMARSDVRKMREEAAKQGLVERIGSNPIYSCQPTWQYLTDRQLGKQGDS